MSRASCIPSVVVTGMRGMRAVATHVDITVATVCGAPTRPVLDEGGIRARDEGTLRER
jgi:hypothetical protein